MKDDGGERCGGYKGDVVPLTAPDEHGRGVALRHLPGGEHEIVQVQAAQGGASGPPGSEFAAPMGDGSYGSERLLAGSGPAQVATAAYRNGWTNVFGKQEVGQA